MVRAPLMSLDEALTQVLAQASREPLATEWVDTFEAHGRVLREAVVSPLDVPAKDNTSMDGYALNVEDLAHWPQCAPLKVSQRIPAGQVGEPLQRGEAARIFTGAWIPEGANAVAMQEDCSLSEAGELQLLKPVQAAQWIRRQGEDVRVGQVVLAAGERLEAASLGLAASVGSAQLRVSRQPRVALFSTGDELVMPGEVAPQDLRAGSIYNSNRFFLRSLLKQLGCQVTDFGIVPDRREATQHALEQAALANDVILTSGGVSVGEEDHVKPSVEALGSLHLWSLSMKPGKPFALGEIESHGVASKRATHFMGLPGNPVSSFVTFLILVRPFLLALQGATQVAPKVLRLQAHFDWPRADPRREFLRVKLNDQGGLSLFENQSSGVLTSCVWADGLVDNPAQNPIQRGDWVRYLPFSELGL
jgi:molybdopterin molybdotransferase